MRYERPWYNEVSEYVGRASAELIRPHLSQYWSIAQAGAILTVLRSHMRPVCRDLEDSHKCKLAVYAIGSLGRGEYVPGVSDLDLCFVAKSEDIKAPADLSSIDLSAAHGPVAKHLGDLLK